LRAANFKTIEQVTTLSTNTIDRTLNVVSCRRYRHR
jgi:hypothetical protein